jgi:hypothetical protein
MHKIFFLLAFITLLFTGHVDAQHRDTVIAYMKKFVIAPWLPLGSKITLSKDSADFIRMVTVPQSGADKHLFPVNDYYLNGAPKLQCNSNIGLIEAELQGICVEYFPDGKRKRISNYDKGALSGDITEYFPNGKLYLYGVYKNDTLIINRCNDSTGRILTENGNGIQVIYNEDFKHVIGSGSIKNGFKDGDWSGTLEDSISYTANYKAGDIVSGMSLSKSGRKYPFNKEYTAPDFAGGLHMLGAYLSKTIRYPRFAVENNIQGKVIVIFTVDQDGNLHNIHPLLKDDVLSREALRVMRLSPKWQPATSYGVPVTVVFATPIGFTLERN